MKLARSTSCMLLRMSRATYAATGNASVITGSTRKLALAGLVAADAEYRPVDAEHQREQRPDDESRQHHAEHREAHERVVEHASSARQAANAPSGTPMRNASTAAARPIVRLSGRPLGDQLGDAEVLVAQRRTEIALRHAREISPVLHDAAADRGRTRRRDWRGPAGGSACSWSKGPPGASRMMKNDSADQHEQCRNESGNAPQRVGEHQPAHLACSRTPSRLPLHSLPMELLNPDGFSSQSNASSTTTCASA